VQIQAVALAALSQAEAGVSAASQRLSAAAAGSADSVTLSSAAVELLQARTAFEAAIEVTKTVDEIAESTLDVLA